MKVREWIEWLKRQPQENEVVLRDPDTEWYLPLLAAPTFPYDDDTREGRTTVFAEYN